MLQDDREIEREKRPQKGIGHESPEDLVPQDDDQETEKQSMAVTRRPSRHPLPNPGAEGWDPQNQAAGIADQLFSPESKDRRLENAAQAPKEQPPDKPLGPELVQPGETLMLIELLQLKTT